MICINYLFLAITCTLLLIAKAQNYVFKFTYIFWKYL